MLQQENQIQSANFEWACQALSAKSLVVLSPLAIAAFVRSVLLTPLRRRSVTSLRSRAR